MTIKTVCTSKFIVIAKKNTKLPRYTRTIGLLVFTLRGWHRMLTGDDVRRMLVSRLQDCCFQLQQNPVSQSHLHYPPVSNKILINILYQHILHYSISSTKILIALTSYVKNLCLHQRPVSHTNINNVNQKSSCHTIRIQHKSPFSTTHSGFMSSSIKIGSCGGSNRQMSFP